MKKIILIAVSTFAALVALFSYPTSTGQSGTTAAQPVSAARIVTGAATPAPTTTGQGPDPATKTPPSTSAPGSPAASAPTTTAAAAAAVTVQGASEMTRYGPVQVQVTITGGKITDATAIDYPQSSGRDMEINSYAIPQLQAEVLQAQSAKIDAVSGATFTSDGYVTSLQSALDAAGFKG